MLHGMKNAWWQSGKRWKNKPFNYIIQQLFLRNFSLTLFICCLQKKIRLERWFAGLCWFISAPSLAKLVYKQSFLELYSLMSLLFIYFVRLYQKQHQTIPFYTIQCASGTIPNGRLEDNILNVDQTRKKNEGNQL